MNKITLLINDEEKTYKVPTQIKTLMQAFEYIEEVIDPCFEFDVGCRSGVCGSCSVKQDGKAVLACQTLIKQNQQIEPLSYCEVVEGLRVKRDYSMLKSCQIIQNSEQKAKKEDVQKIVLQSDCILCYSCYSACPVLEVNRNFMGPFALTRVLKYVDDIKEEDKKMHIDTVQKNGVWDCTLCGECTLVCPQGIDSKLDIIELRNKSVQSGYSDPTFQTMNFGF